MIHIRTPQARTIKWINLTRPMATTHSWDSNQRLVDIPHETHGFCALHGYIPDNPCLAPPGWYMLTITDHDGIPSDAHWVQLVASDHQATKPAKKRARRPAAITRKAAPRTRH